MTESSPPAPTHDDLPLPDYDHLPTESLRHRIRALDRDALTRLLAYERAHAHRVPVIVTIESRMAQLDDGEQPSGGDQRVMPELPPPPAGGSPVSPATSGPAQNPPSHGDPTNPAQPR